MCWFKRGDIEQAVKNATLEVVSLMTKQDTAIAAQQAAAITYLRSLSEADIELLLKTVSSYQEGDRTLDKLNNKLERRAEKELESEPKTEVDRTQEMMEEL